MWTASMHDKACPWVHSAWSLSLLADEAGLSPYMRKALWGLIMTNALAVHKAHAL